MRAIREEDARFLTRPAFWHVAFIRDETEHLIDLISPKGFRHVLCYGYVMEFGAWIVVDPSIRKNDIHLIKEGGPMAEFLWGLMGRGATVVRMPSREQAAPIDSALPATCVNIVKRTIGIRSGALRPIALYRDLLADGGEIVFEKGKRRETESESPAGRPAA